MDLLAFERKLDQTIVSKRLDIQEALKQPISKNKSCEFSFLTLSIWLSQMPRMGKGQWLPGASGWLLEDSALSKYDATKQKRTFSSFLSPW